MARVAGVGVDKIRLDNDMLDDIKEAITRQDIRDLISEKLITVKEDKGKRKKFKKKSKGKGRIKIARKNENYVYVTRKLRSYIKDLRDKGKIDKEKYHNLRNKIRARMFKGLSHMKQEIK